MKHFFLSLFMLAFIQIQAQNKFGLGFKIGQNFSTVDNVLVDHNSASYHAGIVSSIGINSVLSIAPEVILSQTKLETSIPLTTFVSTTIKPETFHLSYLTIPLLLQYKPVKSFLVQAGPQYGILLDQKKDGIDNATMAFKGGEFAFVGGAKLDLGGFFIYGRYVIGLENIKDTKQLSASLQDQSTWKTRQWQLGFGLNLFNF